MAAFDWINTVGSVAGFCTTISMLPQLHSIWRRKSARDVSLTMILVLIFGIALWIVYGLGIGSVPIIVTNGVSLMVDLSVLAIKLHYDRKHASRS
jgi:MtN3 and saliva related transmembrane protein